MPLPTPKNNEEKQDFISRCVADSKTREEAKDNKQAVAMCNSQWESSKENSQDKLNKAINLSNSKKITLAGILEAKEKVEKGMDSGVVLEKGMIEEDRLPESYKFSGGTSYLIIALDNDRGIITEFSYEGGDLQFDNDITTGDRVNLVILGRYAAMWIKEGNIPNGTSE